MLASRNRVTLVMKEWTACNQLQVWLVDLSYTESVRSDSVTHPSSERVCLMERSSLSIKSISRALPPPPAPSSPFLFRFLLPPLVLFFLFSLSLSLVQVHVN